MIYGMVHGQVTTPSPARDAYDEYFNDTGVRLAYLFQGDSLTEKISGDVSLVQVGSASYDEVVSDTIDRPGLGWSHAYRFIAGVDSYDANQMMDFGDGSLLIHVSGYGALPAVGIVDVAGNEDATAGFCIQTNSAGDLLGTLRFGSAMSLSIAGSFTANNWWDACMIIDRPSGQAGIMRFGTIDIEKTMAVAAGSLNSARVFSIGSGRVTSFLGRVMSVRIALGDQVMGLSPKYICERSARRIWHEATYSRVTTAAK